MAAQQEPSKKPADAKAGADAKAPAKEAKPRKSGKLMLILGLVVLLAGGGAGAYIFLGGDEHAETAVAKEEPPVFLALEAFTVNLLPVEGLQQYLQVNVTLKIAGQAPADVLKARMPEVRNRILLILSSKRPAELLPANGKQKLATEIGDVVIAMVEKPKADPASKNGAAPAAAQGAVTPVADTKGAAEGANQNGAAPRQRSVEVLFTGFIIQ